MIEEAENTRNSSQQTREPTNENAPGDESRGVHSRCEPAEGICNMTNITPIRPNGNGRHIRTIPESLLEELAELERQGFRITNSAANYANSGAHTGGAYDSRMLSPQSQSAVRLTNLGFFVTPLCWPTAQGRCGCPKRHTDPKEIGKAPLLGEGYQEKLLSTEEVIKAWTLYPHANVGILLKHSELFVLDSDSEEADRELERREVPPGPRVRTAKGFHRYFRNTSGIIGRTTKRGESRTLDVFSDGYVIATGSTHRTGTIYTEEVSFEEWPLEDPPAWAIALLKESKKLEAEIESLPDDLTPVDLDLLTLPAWVKKVIREGHTVDPKYPSRSEAVFAVLTTLLKARCTTAIIAGILLDPQYKISEKPREQGRKWLASDIARARVRTDEEESQCAQTQGAPLPSIQTNNRPLRDISGDALRALLLKNDPPVLFTRGGAPARVTTDERGRPIIGTVGEPAMRGALTRAAEFLRVTAKTNNKTGDTTFHDSHVSPPLDVVRDILSLPEQLFPPLLGVVEAPVLRPDGSILVALGYDSATRLYHHPTSGLTIPALNDTPTADHAVQARTWVQDELLPDFPFAEGADIANFFAVLLTPIVRPAINGCVPLCLLDKPGPGSGATLLADLVATIASGEHAAKQTAPEGRYGEAEWKKLITSILLKGAQVVVFDNIDESLASSHLSSVLTTPIWEDRLLGVHENITLPVRATWIATANNITLRGDLARRCYRVRLDPQVEKPWTREGFKKPDLLGWTRSHRGHLLAALLTMARAWFIAGQPAPADKPPKLGGFEPWTCIVGGILAFSGLGGFLENQEDIYSIVDDEGPAWAGFLAAWAQEIGSSPVTVRELVGFHLSKPTVMEALPDSIDYDPDKQDSSRKKLGKALKKHASRVHGGYRLEQKPSAVHGNVKAWKVSKI